MNDNLKKLVAIAMMAAVAQFGMPQVAAAHGCSTTTTTCVEQKDPDTGDKTTTCTTVVKPGSC